MTLFADWREFQKPPVIGGVADYSADAMRLQARELERYLERLAAIDPSGWPISQQVDHHIVRAEMNGLYFDHRVLRPWSRNPAFYKVLLPSDTDVPAREGSVMYGALELWTYRPPLSVSQLRELRERLDAVPRILARARENLIEDARDLWYLGIRVKENESRALSDFASRTIVHHPELGIHVDRARLAVDEFRAWLEQQLPTKSGESGVGVDSYDWYLAQVQLVPHTWAEQRTIVQRELDRAWAYLKLAENQSRRMPALAPVGSADDYRRRYRAAVSEFVEFLQREEVFTVPAYVKPALEAREGSFAGPDRPLEFFNQVNYRDLRVMRPHGTHWFDLARMKYEPHPSPIRSVPLLYNVWASRAEGLATAMEEMMLAAGFLQDDPRSGELIYVLLAQRAARAMAELKMHSRELTLEEAVRFTVTWTPRGWLSPDGNTAWVEQHLYLEQPGYGTSYVVGKTYLDRLNAERANQLGDQYTLRGFMDELHGAGMIPLSLIRWEMTGRDDEIRLMAERAMQH